MWLDIRNGAILKRVNIGIDSYGDEYEFELESTITYGVVTDEDVARPDLTGYTEMIEE